MSNRLACSGFALCEGSRPLVLNRSAIPHLEALQPYKVNPALSHSTFAQNRFYTVSLQLESTELCRAPQARFGTGAIISCVPGLAFSEGSRPVEMNKSAIPQLEALQPYKVNPALGHSLSPHNCCHFGLDQQCSVELPSPGTEFEQSCRVFRPRLL